MTSALAPRPKMAVLTLVILVMLVLAGCAPQITSPVGVWHATGDDSGTITINEDGTFTVTDASFSLITYRDTDNNFNGTGTWNTIPDDPEIILWFSEAKDGNFVVGPSGRRANFTSGTMRFTHPEETASIEFRLAE